jgi:hypothetical protein
MIKHGWSTPSIIEIQDSIVKSVLTKDEITMLHGMGIVRSKTPIKYMNVEYDLNLWYNKVKEKFELKFIDTKTGSSFYNNGCEFIANNLSEIQIAITSTIPDIHRIAGAQEYWQKEQQKKQEQETKCKVKLWTKFNQ